jgi:amino acid adenylation domain-containing protein
MQKQGPLSYSQESLWFLSELDPTNNAYNSVYLFRLIGGVDHQVMERALNEIVRRHEVLRTVYPSRGGQPLMQIHSHAPMPLPYVDYSSLLPEEREAVIQKYVLEHGRVPFNLYEGPLTRFALLHAAPQEDYLFFAIHHIGFDAWSRHVLIGELVQLYGDFRSGNGSGLPNLPIQYVDYALWQRDWLCGDTLKTYVEHWKNILSGELPILDLPTDYQRPSIQTYRGARHHFRISPAISNRVKEFCKKEHLTPFHFFLAAYAVLLMRYTGQEDIITGCPFANRPLPELDGIIGAFINTLPIRLNLGGDPSVRSLLGQVRAVMLDAFSWQAVPFEALVSELSPQRDLSRTPVFQVLINMRNVPKRSHAIEGLEVKDELLDDATAAFDISLELGDAGDHFSAAVRYNVSLFNQATILKMVSHFQNIIGAMLEESESPLSGLGMLNPSERQSLLLDWNDTRSEFPQNCIHELISEQAAKNPDAQAVICNGRHLTYSTLEKKANQLAAYLLARGVEPGTRVGIFLPRSEELLVAQLAILKAGGAYVPFDLTYPVERLVYILKDAVPALIVTDSSSGSQIPDQLQRIYLDSDAGKIQTFPEQENFTGSDLDSPVYVTYTSGSTGRPKGVVNIQRGVVNYLHHLVKTFHLKAGERVIQFTPLSFDAAFRDTLGVLTFGGTVVLMDDEQMRNPDFINTAIVEQQIACNLSVVPTMLRALAQSMLKNPTLEHHLRLIMPSGEALQVADIKLVKEAFGKAVQIVNQYGPTECSMISTLYTIPEVLPADIPDIPIGKPISNVRVYVLDQNRQPVPVGVMGELYIGGIGVGLGYLNQPALTAERFFSDPFWPGNRMYRSGDRVRYLPDGMLSFLGRLDHQVKIRGYRVELGEIDAVIGEFPNIQAAAVVLRQHEGSEMLAAYITLFDKDQEFVTDNLQQYLKDRLPFYMLPSTITILDEMPLTPNRKIDRRSLPSPESRNGQAHLAPRNDIERRLVSIWKEVLEVEQVGVRDNFFELGGHSLMAVRLFSRIEQEFGQALPLLLLFKEGTVEALATILAGEKPGMLMDGVVSIQPEGDLPPLFILSASLYMRPLALAMGTMHPIYGLHSQENGQLVYRGSVQETAEIFHRCLTNFYPDGPYLLLGHSAHGLFAIELARLLRREGKQVAFLGLLDTYPPGSMRQVKLIDRVKIQLINLQNGNLADKVKYLKLLVRRLGSRWLHGIIDVRSTESEELKKPVKEIRRRLVRAYKPEPYDGNAHLFSASDRPWYIRWDPMEEWVKTFTGPFEVVKVPGDHMSMLQAPRVDILAEKINARLSKNEAE